jgi:hypothetical protein
MSIRETCRTCQYNLYCITAEMTLCDIDYYEQLEREKEYKHREDRDYEED